MLRSERLLASHPKAAPAAALTAGFHDALLAGVVFAAAGALLAAVLLRRRITSAAAGDTAPVQVLERAAKGASRAAASHTACTS